MNVVARTLAAAAVGALLVPVATAQDLGGWREMAAREEQRVREAQRAEFIRAQYERRRSMAHARLRSGEGSTLYASTLSAADVQLSCPVEPAPGMHNVIELVIDGRHDNPVSSAGGVAGQPGLTAPFGLPGIFSPVGPHASAAWDFDTVHGGHLVSENPGATASVGTAAAHGLPFLPSASDARGRQGIAHVLNRSTAAGEVRIVAVDDSGRRYGPLRLSIRANETAQVTSADIENGNADKGLFGATGPGVGDWRLELSSDLDIEALSYVRASDGWVTAMHDVAPREGTRHRVPFFNPASNIEHESRLRLINPGGGPAEVAITGIDSRGETPGDGVAVTLPAGASLTYTAAELESGTAAGLRGSLGDGTGEWRLIVESEQPLQAMSLLSSSTGHLTNLSTAPSSEARGVQSVPLFPAASDPSGRQGLVRVVNRTDTAGQLRVTAHDDTQWGYAPLVLPIGAGETVHFDSNDLEQGNPGKGLSGGTGSGQGDWRLELSSDVDIEVLSYVRAWDGLLTPMHDVVPSEADGTRHRVAMFDPEGSPEQERVLRLINPGSASAEVAISGVDARGRSLGEGVAVTLPAGASRTYTAEELQTGEGIGLRGSLGDRTSEWRLTVESQAPLQVMSLLSGPTGHLSNLSTAPVLVPKTLPPVFATDTETPGAQTAEDVFRTEVSPIVQAQCIVCHRSGGFPADVPNSRLQFNPSTVEGHVALNLAVIEAFLAVLGDDEEVEDPATYILNKVQGVGHGGGLQLTAGTDNYASLERFLGLLGEAVAPVGITPETLFEGVTMESPRQTLRRAAIVFAGRVPTDAEFATIEAAGDEDDASEETLRATIRGLMTGPGFHEFLIRASNDRLLTDRDDIQGVGVIDPIFGYFVDYNNLNHEKLAAGNPNHWRWRMDVDYGIRRAPLELIAHIVENDLPYTEILTANYIMANPMAAEAYGATTDFDDAGDVHEFKPSTIASYYRTDDSKQQEYTFQFGNYVSNPGNLATDYPHAGILNTTVFLKRYPTTATNRNRARSRWTNYHFLGLDVEKSASRTTDPVALADTNNPTLKNPACTVCHTVLDPVAGAFQNYDDVGYYRSSWGGLESLDDLYKGAGPAGAEEFEITGRTEEESQVISVRARLQQGSNNFGFQNVNPSESCCTNILIDSIAIRDDAGDLVARYEMEQLADWDEIECGGRWGDLGVDIHCRVVVSTEVPTTADYQIDIASWIGYQSDEAQGNLGGLRVWVPMPDDFFHEGDSWYRDMRTPGFNGTSAPDASASLQWLAQQFVADERFAEAAVRFWWPAIMGSEIAEPPEDGDAHFDGRLLASNAQAAEVERLAEDFRQGFGDGEPYNLKDLLTEIVSSRWFRASTLADDDVVRANALSVAGAKRLLTPEELSRKTLAVTGFGWQRGRPSNSRGDPIERTDWAAPGAYGLLYGGIDSGGIAERARDITPIMGGVAKRHGAAVACPVVFKDFYMVGDGERQLFNGVDWNSSPAHEFGAVFDVEAESAANKQVLSIQGTLQQGQANAVVSLTNELWDEDKGGHARQLFLDRLVLRDDSGSSVETREFEDLDHDCVWDAGEAGIVWDTCRIGVPLDVPTTGTYEIEVTAWAEHDEGALSAADDDLAKLEIVAEGNTETSAGAAAIKTKLTELYSTLLGVPAGTDDSEIEDAYDLFVTVWGSTVDSSGPNFDMRCEWNSDQYYFDGIVNDVWLEPADGEEWDWDRHGWDDDRLDAYFDTIDMSDRHHVARTWVAMLAYLLTDYRYLFL